MKIASIVISGICALVVCFVFLPQGISAKPSSTAPGETISITYDFPEPDIEEAWNIPPLKGCDPYFSVTMEGLPRWSEEGSPVLPFKTARILIPYGTDVQDITVTCGNKIALPGSYLVEPGQQQVPLSYQGPVEPTPPDPEIYDSSDPFPGKLYSDATVQIKTGYRILVVNLHPVEYIPKPGQLSYYESMTVNVALGAILEAAPLPVINRPQDEEVVRNMVDNPETISSYSTSAITSEPGSLLSGPGDYEYVIITNEALNTTAGPNNFQALRDDKISRGITATIVTTEWLYASYSGSRPDGGEDNQTRIRNFINDAYNTWGTRYVLLGGDGDESGDTIIPHRDFYCGGEYIPADIYYACLDGTFDNNANGIYGEINDGPGGGEVDLFAEVYVGRASVDSEAEVQNFVAKTLAYQNTPLSDENLRKVWSVGEYLGFGGVAEWGGNYKDEIKEGSDAHGYTTVGFEDSIYAPSFDVSTLYDRDYPGNHWPKSEIIDVINDNAHLINHLGHAWIDYVMKMYNSDVDGMTNDELHFIGYSQGCYPGAFDYDDCIAEHLTTEAHGATAFIANSRSGWGTGYSTDGPSQHYDREFWDAVLGEHIHNIGIANQDSKEDNAGRISATLDRWCYYQINLFGDPELSLKLREAVLYDSHTIYDSAGGDGDGYPEPGENITMPVTLRNTSGNTTFTNVTASLSASTILSYTVLSDDFEGGWPGNWTVGDSDPGSGSDYWGQSSNSAHSGNYSAYCAEVSDVPGQFYDNDMAAYMHQDVNLSAYDSTTLSYHYWLTCEVYYDHLDAGYYDGSWHWVQSYTGSSGGWVSDSIEIPVTATKVGFIFFSDYSITHEGAYIDDVLLTGYVLDTDPYITVTDDYETYGDIPPGGTAASLDAYDFDIDPGCPVEHEVIFNLNSDASNGGPWSSSFTVLIGEEGPISDIVQVTTDPSSDYEPAIAQTDDGKVWVVWHCYRSAPTPTPPPTVTPSPTPTPTVTPTPTPTPPPPTSYDIWFKTSDDGGGNWTEPHRITTDPNDDYEPAITQTDDVKVWVVWYSYRSGNSDIWFKTSSDYGATWSPASQITTDSGSDYQPAIAQADGGKVWVVWRSYRSGNSDIWYKTTKDGGATWSDATQLTTDTSYDSSPAIAQTSDGKIWVVWQRYGDIWCKTSDDGGATWSGAYEIPPDPYMGAYEPVIAQTDDDKVWVLWQSYSCCPSSSDIWYTTSSDGGTTWSEASQFTHFVHYDEYPTATALSTGELALAWYSDRFSNYDIWYGIIGSMEDISPPPYLYWAEHDPDTPTAEDTVTVRAQVGDESGVQDVQLVWWENGTPQSNLTMYDDGNHDDYAAGDGVYGVQIGPFPGDTWVLYQIQITDIDANTIVAPPYLYWFEVWEKTADILLVEDGQSWCVQYYSDTLDTLGYAYDYWDDDQRGCIDADTLNLYTDGIVIWAVPDWGCIGWSEVPDSLASYLDDGGSLFISGQDVGNMIGYTDFYEDYLHAEFVKDDTNLYGLFGVPDDPITDGLYVSISGGDGANNQYYPSEIDPISPAVTIFTYPTPTPTPSPTPTPTPGGDITPPTLLSITWIDNDADGTINAGDDLVFHFSESMDHGQLSNMSEINSRLDSTRPGSLDYGITNAALAWSANHCWLTVTLGTEETISGGETVDPSADVTDKQGNADATMAPGPAIPLPPDTTYPTLLDITWIDNDASGWIDQYDYLVFNFSEAMDTTTITAGIIDAALPTNPFRTYGTTGLGLAWDASSTWLTVTLGTEETITGGETVNPAATVTDGKGNADCTLSEIPLPLPPDTTNPTLLNIGWADVDGDNIITGDDDLVFNFSEAMDKTTIVLGTVDADLPTGKTYGTTNLAVNWNTAGTRCTVTLGDEETIDGAETVDPAVTVTDKKGNFDATAAGGPTIPSTPTAVTQETTKPTLLDITWLDYDDDGTINVADDLVFNFSEAMNPPTIVAGTVNTVLDSTATSGTFGDYGITGLVVTWSAALDDCWVTVILGVEECISGGEMVNPTAGVTDRAGNADNTAAPGASIPLAPDTTKPTLLSVTWNDADTDGNISQNDHLIFNFSEAMDTTTIAAGTIDADLPAMPLHSYGSVVGGDLVWSLGDTRLTLTLPPDATIVGGETVNPAATVTDKKGNSDATSSPAIPIVPDITAPTLNQIEWNDIDGSSFIDVGDTLVFYFSEAMDDGTITAANVNARLDSTAGGAADYGTVPAVSWNSGVYTQCTVTLDTGETIDGNEVVNPTATVTDRKGNPDATSGSGPAIPTTPGAPPSTPTPTPTLSPALAEPFAPEQEWVRGGSDDGLPQWEPIGEDGETSPPKNYSGERESGTMGIVSSGSGALRVDTGTYRVVYFAFGFEAINSAADRETVMDRVIGWLSQQGWSVPMTAETNTEGSNLHLELGTHPIATDGYDSSIDVPHAPPGPGATFDAYFDIDDPLFPHLDKDYRGPMDNMVSEMHIGSDTEGKRLSSNAATTCSQNCTWVEGGIQWALHVEADSDDITLTWDAAEIPSDRCAYMNTGTEVIDMKATTNTTLPAGQYSIAILVCVETDISLKAGWNMVSVPVVALDNSVESVFPGAELVCCWDRGNQTYICPPAEIEPCRGYWVAMMSNTTIPVCGSPVYQWTSDIIAPWNMIGSVIGDVWVTDWNDEPGGSVEPYLWWWNPTERSYDFYVLPTNIESTKGYWVAATGNCTLTLP